VRLPPLLPSLLLLAASCGGSEAPSNGTPAAVGSSAPTTKHPAAQEAAEALADARPLLVVGPGADPPRALERLTQVFGEAPADVEAALLLARAAFRSEQSERCRAALDAYFALDPKEHPEWSAEAWALRGWLLEREGRPREALPFYDRAIELVPAYAFAYHRRGSALADAGDEAGAIEQLRKAIALRPGRVESHFTLSRVLRRAGRVEEAERESTIHRLLNQTLDNTSNTPEAIAGRLEAYEKLEAELPEWIEGRLVLARMQVKLGKEVRARERLRRLVAEHPESAEAKALLEQVERLFGGQR
jgi:tetratricopeptide (TPR) repeat protein